MHAWVTTTPGATPVCAPENERSRRGFVSQGGSRSFGYFSLVYESGAFPSYVVGRGWRLIPSKVPLPAVFAAWAQSRRAHTCPMTPWRLVTVVDAAAIDILLSTERTLARLDGAVNIVEESRSIQDSIYCAAWLTKCS